jgi:uncharacterized circularly permuted ATP-grasp superfamily protein
MSAAKLTVPDSSVTSKKSMPAYDEMQTPTGLNPDYKPLEKWIEANSAEEIAQRNHDAHQIFRQRGITFAVYGQDAERLIPFDVIPRVISDVDWNLVSSGSIQRVKALNAFLDDIYHKREILKAGIIPEKEVLNNKLYCKAMAGVHVPRGVHSHISGVDLVRVGASTWYVLEDNLRTPSGVSYMLENRSAHQRLNPELFRNQSIEPNDHYPDVLRTALRDCAPKGIDEPTVVVLTPGAANSAYFEHGFLANAMGVLLVEGCDLFVKKQKVYARTVIGPKQVHVIYRRIDDDFLDPKQFNPHSLLGVPGIFEAYRAGNVNITNAVGNGVADDKATYLHVPAMIKFYLGEEPILANVPTYKCSDKKELAYVIENLHELVVKEVHGSGGYGMLVGPASSAGECAAYKKRILADPSDFIAQPTLALSTCPTFVEQGIAPRHVDLRPYVVSGKEVTLVPGALTRVALKEGSLVVNSSQGGGTKDTWVVAAKGTHS